MNKVEHASEIEKLIDICHANLKNSNKCLEYLTQERGLSEETIKKYKLGYFPQNIRQLSRFLSGDTLRNLMIMDYSGSSKFSEFFYLIFPIFSEYREPVAISGRTLLDDSQRSLYNLSKYKNSSYKKAQILYGFDHSRKYILKEQNAYVVEGFFDHIAMDSNGIKNSVAICGTAFSSAHFLKLSRYTDKITFVLDSDDGGQKSMERINDKFCNKGIKLRFLLLPNKYKDVDQYFSSGKTIEDFSRELKRYIPNW